VLRLLLLLLLSVSVIISGFVSPRVPNLLLPLPFHHIGVAEAKLERPCEDTNHTDMASSAAAAGAEEAAAASLKYP
jgi:hypothetical protein